VRTLFRKLKFRRLLHTIEAVGDEGFRIRIDGPFSLFRAVTRYGLQLALLIPALDDCGPWQLEAELRWGALRRPLAFHAEGPLRRTRRDTPTGDPEDAGDDASLLPDEVAALLRGFRELETPWTADVSRRVLDLPGVGLCVPDLEFRHPEHERPVYLEVLGHWSREAVWKRVDLVRGGLGERILFAVPKHLRVSEAVLEDDLPAALHVYARSIRASSIARRLDALVAAGPP
jgi:hypothetical protein